MFQTISWVSLGLVLAGIVVHRLVSPRPRLAKGKVAEGSGLFRRGCCGENLSTLAKFNRLACMLAIASLLLLFVSGFAERMLFGEQIHGYTLMLHVGLAPVFVICAGVIAVAWGHQCRLNEDDRRSLANLLCLKKTASADTADLGWKLTFWLAIFLVVPVSLSMVLSMFPIFGTHGQETLLCLHQYSSLALTLVAMIHVHLVIRRSAKSVPTKPKNDVLGTFSIKDVLGESWTALKENFWLSIGIYLVAGLLIGASGCLVVGPIIIAGPLMGGVFIYALKLLRHEPVEFGDMFAGFNNFGNLLLVCFLFTLFVVLSTLPGLAVMIVFPLVLIKLGAGPEIILIVVGLGTVLVYLLPFYFSIRYSFSILLVADGSAKVGDSLKMSSVGARQNLGRIILFMIVALLINVIASLPFGLGLLVTAPWMGLAWAKIYEDIYS